MEMIWKEQIGNFNNKIQFWMSEFGNQNKGKDSKGLSQSNPFEEYNHGKSDNQFEEQAQYPLCLDTQCPETVNTPLSRLSEVTYQSEIKAYGPYNKNWNSKFFTDDHQLVDVLNLKNNEVQDLKAQLKVLADSLTDLKNYTQLLEKRNEELVVGLEKQKLKSSHLENAVAILRKGEHQLEKKTIQQYELVSQLRQELSKQKDKNLSVMQKLENISAENNYLKELILIANSNYEILQNKYLTGVERNKKIEEQNLTKEKQLTYNMQEMKNLLANLINTPNGPNVLNHNLSFGEQDENCGKKLPLTPNNKGQKKQVEQIYRKMFVKTLKGKK